MVTNLLPSELKPEGYVPVSKHSVSPWELVEGAKGGCNVVPWQEVGGVRYDRQLDKMGVGVSFFVIQRARKSLVSVFDESLLLNF